MADRPDGTRVLMLALRRALLLIVKAIEDVYGKADPEPLK
jgi:hypothetical protein